MSDISTTEPEKKTCMNCGAMINAQSTMCPICGSGDPFTPRLNLQRKSDAANWWLKILLALLGLRIFGGVFQLINAEIFAGLLALLVNGLSFYGVYKEKKWGYYLTIIWAGLDLVLALMLVVVDFSQFVGYIGSLAVDIALLGLAIVGYLKTFRKGKAETPLSPMVPPPPL